MKDLFKRRREVSRKPCEDFVENVATSLSALGVPMNVNRGKDYFAINCKDITEFPAEVRLEASTFAGLKNDHFFMYNIHFDGGTEIEILLQKTAISNIFKGAPTWPKNDLISSEDNYNPRTCTYSDFSRLGYLNLVTPNSVAQNIYDVIRQYASMRKGVSGLIERLQAIEKEKDKLLAEKIMIVEQFHEVRKNTLLNAQ